MRSMTAVLDNHLKCFGERDLEGVLSDYAPDAVLFTAEGPLRGREAIRSLFTAMLAEFGKPGATFRMTQRFVEGDYAYILWTAETADNVYELGTDTFFVRDGKIAVQPLVDAVPPDQVCAGIQAMPLLGHTTDGREIRCGRLLTGSPVLREIGRLRELTFRAVGEGTGRAIDVDAWDSWYEHIVLWDAAQRKIAGAYRIARGAPVLAAQGLKGLYTASLFDYADDALPRLAAGMELGRSFVVPDYWGSRSIDYLWQGIGAYLRCQPGVRYLFGAVSISAALPREAREQLVAYYQRYYGSVDARAQSRQPFAYRAAPSPFGEVDAATAFRVLKANLDALGATLPMLYKQYTELCEPGGARFLAFGVDPDFSDAVDGLIEVDLHRLRPKKRERYLGRTAAAPPSAGSVPQPICEDATTPARVLA